MENKKKKGFTLIELLAIIVILAIIAVITVPIILNIIENSKKGAATDSAYGYKDAVNKAYIQELTKPDNGNLKLNGNYTVQSNALVPSTDNTFGFGVTNYNSLPVDVSGDKPSSGTLTYSNNVLTSGCLVIGDYAVTFNGNETSTVKGNCSSSSEQGSTTPTVKPAIYASKAAASEENPTTKNASEIAVGDYVKLGDDGFYVINPNRNGNVVLMSEYNISNTASETGYNAQNNGIMLMSNKTELALADAYRQDTSSDNYAQPSFSEEYYWENDIATSSVDCEAKYCLFDSNEESAYIYDSTSNLYAPMENYKDYLESATGLTLTVRAMSYSEADSIISNSWAYNQSYWLGSVYDGYNNVWCVSSSGGFDGNIYYNVGRYGVRPVIEISISDF